MVVEVPFSPQSTIAIKRQGSHFCDAYRFEKQNTDAMAMYTSIFCDLPPVVKGAMKLRNTLVKPLGLTAYPVELPKDFQLLRGEKFGLHTIEACGPDEVIAYANEKNMSIWISLTRETDDHYILACVVNMKTRLARAYVGFIIPFHRIVVKLSVKRALHKSTL